MHKITRLGVATLAALSLSWTAAPAGAVQPAAAPGEQLRMPLREAVAALPVATEDRTGYQRSSFKHWVDADRDGCNTRAEVLLDEAVDPPAVGPNCRLSGGRWYSYYDNTYVSGPSGLDVDHVVPLAEAWDSGASEWTAARRQAYANDLGSARSLVAVTARSNRSKADQDPAEWWVPFADASCPYLVDWVTTKTRWQLDIDATERDALTQRAADCPNAPINVEIAG